MACKYISLSILSHDSYPPALLTTPILLLLQKLCAKIFSKPFSWAFTRHVNMRTTFKGTRAKMRVSALGQYDIANWVRTLVIDISCTSEESTVRYVPVIYHLHHQYQQKKHISHDNCRIRASAFPLHPLLKAIRVATIGTGSALNCMTDHSMSIFVMKHDMTAVTVVCILSRFVHGTC